MIAKHLYEVKLLESTDLESRKTYKVRRAVSDSRKKVLSLKAEALGVDEQLIVKVLRERLENQRQQHVRQDEPVVGQIWPRASEG